MRFNIQQRDEETGLLQTVESVLDYVIEITDYSVFWFIKGKMEHKNYLDYKEVRKNVREKAEKLYQETSKDTYIEEQRDKYLSTDRGPRQVGFHEGQIIWKNGKWLD